MSQEKTAAGTYQNNLEVMRIIGGLLLLLDAEDLLLLLEKEDLLLPEEEDLLLLEEEDLLLPPEGPEEEGPHKPRSHHEM